jgi:hypothetical protein
MFPELAEMNNITFYNLTSKFKKLILVNQWFNSNKTKHKEQWQAQRKEPWELEAVEEEI